MDPTLIGGVLEYGPLAVIAFVMVWERQKMTTLLGHQLESLTKIVSSFERYFKEHHEEHASISRQLDDMKRRLEDFP